MTVQRHFSSSGDLLAALTLTRMVRLGAISE